jgi:alkanesulfonate monooxygenase SsuD/methylene tetrahydromethanopterin reductase-like flavin-dependent oxidoreductase (luciferase family)
LPAQNARRQFRSAIVDLIAGFDGPLLPLITDRHINELTLAGTIEEVIEHIVMLIRAGIDEIIIRPFAPEGGSIEETIASFASRVWPQVMSSVR